MFGALSDVKVKGKIKMYTKNLIRPLHHRKSAMIGFLRFDRAINLVVFEDGYICHLKNENDEGVIS